MEGKRDPGRPRIGILNELLKMTRMINKTEDRRSVKVYNLVTKDLSYSRILDDNIQK